MKRNILPLLLLTAGAFAAQPERKILPSPLVSNGGPPGLVRAGINGNALNALRAAGQSPIRLKNFPLTNTAFADLDVVPFDVLTSDAKVVGVRANNGNNVFVNEVPIKNTVQLLRGRIRGKPHSSLVLGFTDKGVTGFIQDEADGLFIVAQDNENADTVVYNAASSTAPMAMLEDELLELPAEGRQLLDTIQEQKHNLRHNQEDRDLAGAERCYRIAVDTLSDFQAGLGRTMTEKADYIKTVMAAVSVLLAGIQDWKNDYYIANDFQMFASVVSYIRVYEDNAKDWYTPGRQCRDAFISGDCLLTDTRNYWTSASAPSMPSYHVLITMANACGPAGGVAWRDQICNPVYPDYNYAIAGCMSGNFPLPVETSSGNPQGGTWDLVVVAHELGHSFSSHHTHDYDPPIDTCATNCNTVPSGGGTIMSYCHTCNGGMSNIDVRFHERVMDFMSSTRKSMSDNCTALTDDPDTCSALIDNYISNYIGSDECGNSICEASLGETCITCPNDCPDCCGDYTCAPSLNETCTTCSQDCTECCGDGTCEASLNETCSTCPDDCEPCCAELGDSCGVDSDCCSQNCKGPQGRKTCK